MTAIDPRMSADMREAIRLTREGRLAEATALMQRLFQGKRHSGSTPEAWPGSAATGTSPPSARHASRVFDVDHTTGAVKNADGAIYRGVASGIRAAPSPSHGHPRSFAAFSIKSTCLGRQETRRPPMAAYWRAGTGRRAVRGRPFMRARMGAAPTSCMSQADFVRVNPFHSSSCCTDALSRPTILLPAHG